MQEAAERSSTMHKCQLSDQHHMHLTLRPPVQVCARKSNVVLQVPVLGFQGNSPRCISWDRGNRSPNQWMSSSQHQTRVASSDETNNSHSRMWAMSQAQASMHLSIYSGFSQVLSGLPPHVQEDKHISIQCCSHSPVASHIALLSTYKIVMACCVVVATGLSVCHLAAGHMTAGTI